MSQRLPVDQCLSDDLLARVFSMLESDVVQELKTHFLDATIPKTEIAWHITRSVGPQAFQQSLQGAPSAFQPVSSYVRAFPTRHVPAWSGGYKTPTPLCKPFWQSPTVQVYKVLLLHFWPQLPPPRV